MEMTELLKDLAATKVVRVTGSYADDSWTYESDIDFKVKDEPCEMGLQDSNRPIRKVISVLEKHGVKWASTFPGYIHTHMLSGNGHLPVQLEFGDVFKPRKGRKKEVEIYGVKFKTY